MNETRSGLLRPMPALWVQLVLAFGAVIVILAGMFLPAYPVGVPAPLWAHALNWLRIAWVIFVVAAVCYWGLLRFHRRRVL